MTILGVFFLIVGILFIGVPMFHQWTDKGEILMPFVFAVPGFLFFTTGLGILLFKAFQRPKQ